MRGLLSILRDDIFGAGLGRLPVEKVSEMLDGLDQVEWGRLSHAYGTAEDIPHLIRALTSSSPEERGAAFSELYGNIWHQGTIYEATPYVVPFLIELAASEQSPGRNEILSYLGSLAEGRSYLDVHRTVDEMRQEQLRQLEVELSWVAQVRNAVKVGEALYWKILQDSEHKLSCAAGYVLSRFPEEGQRYWEPLRVRYEAAENDELVRCGIAILTKEFSASGTSDTKWLVRMFEREDRPSVRVALAVSIALSNEQRRDDALQFLAANLLTDSPIERGYQAQPWDSGEAIWDIIHGLCASKPGRHILVCRFNDLLFQGASRDRLDYVRYLLGREVHPRLRSGELKEGAFSGELDGPLRLLTVPDDLEEPTTAQPDQLALDF